jgi:hypothetical protein
MAPSCRAGARERTSRQVRRLSVSADNGWTIWFGTVCTSPR